MSYTTTATSTMLQVSPLSSGSNRLLDAPLPFYRNTNVSDFQIERIPKQQTQVTSRKAAQRRAEAEYEDELAFQESVTRLLAAKTRPSATSGRIPLDPSTLVLFFRSKVPMIFFPLLHKTFIDTNPRTDRHYSLTRLPHRYRLRHPSRSRCSHSSM